MKSVKHILVVRLSAMGDVVMTVEVIKALRASYPDIRITVLTRPLFKVFFRDVENIEFLPLDLGGRHKGAAGLLRLASDAKRAGVDAVADMHDVLRSKVLRVLLRLCGCRVRHIDKGRADKRSLVRNGYGRCGQLTPTVERYRKTLMDLGLKIPQIEAPVRSPRPIPEAVVEMCGAKTGMWVGIAPFAGHEGKTYPVPLTERLASILAHSVQRVFLFGGGERERQITEAIAEKNPNIFSVIGRLGLGEELDLISNLDAIVTMDSSAMHMASIVGTRAVSVWGATHPYAGFYGLGQNPDDALGLEMDCRPCSVYGNKPCRKGDYPCLRGITPESIAAKVLINSDKTTAKG